MNGCALCILTRLTYSGTVEERVLDVSSRKRLETETLDEKSPIDRRLDQSEARGLRQNIGKLLERRGVGEIVDPSELWKCLFGNAEQNRLRHQAMKEVQREAIALAAENRRDAALLS